MAKQRALFDTSVLIAHEAHRRIDATVADYAVALSVVTLGELYAGVHAATSAEVRSRRLETLNEYGDVEVLPVDEDAAAQWGSLRAHLADQGRRVNVNDLWIAATAVSRDLPLLTQDDDFDALVGVRGLTVVRV